MGTLNSNARLDPKEIFTKGWWLAQVLLSSLKRHTPIENKYRCSVCSEAVLPSPSLTPPAICATITFVVVIAVLYIPFISHIILCRWLVICPSLQCWWDEGVRWTKAPYFAKMLGPSDLATHKFTFIKVTVIFVLVDYSTHQNEILDPVFLAYIILALICTFVSRQWPNVTVHNNLAFR